MGHWHIKQGLEGYGPEPDDDGFPTATDVVDLCDQIVNELGFAVEFLGQGISNWREQAKGHRSSGNTEAELGAYREMIDDTERAEGLEALANKYDPKRREAPLYKDDLPKWEAEMMSNIQQDFSGLGVFVAQHSKLYVWECDEADCTKDDDEE